MSRGNRWAMGSRCSAVAAAVGFLLGGVAFAEEPEATLREPLEAREEIDQVLATSDADELIADEYSRGSPQKSYLGLSAALRAEDYKRGAHYLDLSQLPDDAPSDAGETLAWIMRRILHQSYDSRSLLERLRSLGVSSDGMLDDGLPPDFERLLSIPSRLGGLTDDHHDRIYRN